MKEYIERDKAVSVLYRYCHTVDGRCCGPDDVVELYEELKSIPAADVVEVRHGVPNPIEEVYDVTGGAHVYRHIVGYSCPFCGSDRIAKYCADCGAKMD